MKKLIALCLVAVTLLSFTGCKSNSGTFALEEDGDIIKITLDNFCGEKKIEIEHPTPSGETLFCSVVLVEGKLRAYSTDYRVFNTEQKFFDVESGDGRENDGVYVDEGVTRITLTFIADSSTSGIVYLCFKRNVVNNLPMEAFDMEK